MTLFHRRSRAVRVALRPARARYRTRAAASLLKPLFFLGLGAAGALWAGGVARDAWMRLTWARVRGVDVVPATLRDAPPPEGFNRAVGLKEGDSLLGFSAGEEARRLAAQFPELARVRVRRTLDRRVRVVFQRRRAAAKVWQDGQWLGMDAEGEIFPLRVFAPEDAPTGPLLPEETVRPLPILSGVPPGAPARTALAFVGILTRMPQPWARAFYKMKMSPSGEVRLFLKDGPPVLWGDASADELRVNAKAERLERVLKHPRLAGTAVESVRFVEDGRIVVKTKKEG